MTAKKLYEDRFIVFDGPDCSGKSTAMLTLQNLLTLLGIAYSHTREPGGTPLGETIRGVLLDIRGEYIISNFTQMLLMLASRNQNVDDRIMPALEAGKLVLCDRFSSSTFVYQVRSKEDLESFNNITRRFKSPIPITFIFDISYETYQTRMGNRHEAMDNIEMANKGKENFLRLSSRYLEYAKLYPNTYVVDANGNPETIIKQILDVLHEKGIYKTT